MEHLSEKHQTTHQMEKKNINIVFFYDRAKLCLLLGSGMIMFDLQCSC